MVRERTLDYFSTYFSCCYERYVLLLEHGPSACLHPQWQQSVETRNRIRSILKKCEVALDTLESEAKQIAEKEYESTLG